LPQLEHIFISLSFVLGASDHKSGDGGGGNGSGQVIAIPKLTTKHIPNIACTTKTSVKRKFNAERMLTAKKEYLNMYLI
jgi:hypothetical protein